MKSMRSKSTLLLLVLSAVFALLGLRLIEVALFRGADFLALAESNRYFLKKEAAERAVFLDRYGKPLVGNQKKYFRYVQKDRLYSDKVPINQEEALALLATDSAQVTHTFTRIYPYGEALANVLGYLSPVTAEDLSKESLSLDAQIGRLGLEKFFEKNVRSQPGISTLETNALGQKQRLVASQAPLFGQNISTTIDPLLSQLALQAMQGQTGAVVILDGQNGQVLSLISSPSFDPNVFSEGTDENKMRIRDYLQDSGQVFFNRSVSGAYPPGSVFKMVTALAALHHQAIQADTQVDDQGLLEVGDFAYANWYFTQYGRVEGLVDVRKAIARSNDIFFYKAAEWVGPTKLAEFARAFGFGQKTGLQIDGEATGLVPDPAWKEQTRGENWYLGNTYHFGIGQGDLLVTPLQIATMTQAIAHNGRLCPASLLKDGQIWCKDLALQQEHLDLVISGMLAACSAGGTAYPLFVFNQQQPFVACKTGTAEFGAADERGYRRTHAWLTAIIYLDRAEGYELKEPWFSAGDAFPRQLIITVLVESDQDKPFKEGSADAAPVVERILSGLLDKNSATSAAETQN